MVIIIMNIIIIIVVDTLIIMIIMIILSIIVILIILILTDAAFEFLSIFGIKSGGWVADLFFKWFRGGKVTSAQRLYVVKT